MKLAFRIECPHCKWGVEFRDSYVNQGWLELECYHCDNAFFTKVSVPEVKIEIEKEMAEGLPCTMLNGKTEIK
jgi:hypothetical protein